MHQTIYSNIPSASSIGYVGSNSGVAVISAETPLYSNVRTIEAPGMTYGEQLIHNSRHGIISQRKFYFKHCFFCLIAFDSFGGSAGVAGPVWPTLNQGF